MATTRRHIQDNRECIIVECTEKWISYQADMILRLQPEGLLTAYSSDVSRWIGYIRPESASFAESAQMPESHSVIDGLHKIYEMAEKLLLDPGGIPADPDLWFFTAGKLKCIYIPEAKTETEAAKTDPEKRTEVGSENQKEKIAYMFLMCAARKKCPESELNAYYRYYLETAGILVRRNPLHERQPDRTEETEKGVLKYSLSEACGANPYIADISPSELSAEELPDLLGEDPDTEKGKTKYGLFHKREKKRK